MTEAPLRVLLSHTSDFGSRPAKGDSFMTAAFAALDRAQVVLNDMSLLPASDSSPAQVSAGMATDTDLYIGIIGWRYGSPIRESREVSYTQLEFRAAGEAGVPRLVFLLGEKHKPLDEADPLLERQVAFRQEIADSGITVQQFDSPEKLGMLLYQSLTASPEWDPALLRLYLSAVGRIASSRSALAGSDGVEVPLRARRVGAKEREGDTVDPLEHAANLDRLVVLGGPGAGKSWLAQKAVGKAAEGGLAALASRVPLSRIELPLFVPIPPFFERLTTAPSAWEALVAQAVGEVERFLPNHRCMSRLRRLFELGANPILVILEGLDEAPELRTTTPRKVFDALLGDKRRLLLTSRPAAWHGQLDMTATSKVKPETLELQPLQPEQVRRLLSGSDAPSDEVDAVVAQIDRHPSLADAARVPLVAQLIRIAGPSTTLRELYGRAINRLLRGEWREGDPGESIQPYRRARALIEDWAWRAALEQNDRSSGLADWKDELQVDFSSPDAMVQDAVDNICPIVHQDAEKLLEWRRFLHRTFRERLVAEHIAGLAVGEAVAALEPHLWYDEMWQQVTPAAIAAHPEARLLLRHLLVGDRQDPGTALNAFRDRDGWGELRRMLVLLRQEVEDSLWTGDPVLQPIFESLPKRTPRVALRQTPIADSLRSGDLPMQDAIVPRIRAARFSADEREALVVGVTRRLLSKRPMSASGTLLYRHNLAIALAALESDPAKLAPVREQLITRLNDREHSYQAPDVLEALLALHPTDAERKAIVPAMLVALNACDKAWDVVDMTASILRLDLTREQEQEIRDVLVDRLVREPVMSWMERLIGALGSAGPSTKDVVACVSRVMDSKSYRGFRGRDSERIDRALTELTSTVADQDALLYEVLDGLAGVAVDSQRIALVGEVAKRATVEGRERAVQQIASHILENTGWTFDGLRLLRCFTIPADLQRAVAARLLEMLREPGAFWGSIGEELARLDITPAQRSEATDQLLSIVRTGSEDAVKLSAARTLALLRPESEQRQEALEILRGRVPTLDARYLADMISVLGALGPDGRLDPKDVSLVVDKLESQRFESSSLGFIWAGRIVELGQPSAEIRRRLMAAILVPVGQIRDRGFFSWNDRVIDAATLAGSDESLKAVVGTACNEALRAALEGPGDVAPLLELFDVENILSHFSRYDIGGEQARIATELSAALLPRLFLEERVGIDHTAGAIRNWATLAPAPELVQGLAHSLLDTFPGEAAERIRAARLYTLVNLELTDESASRVGQAVVDELMAGNAGLDPSTIARATVTVDGLRRLIRGERVPKQFLPALVARLRRAVALPVWKEVLPELAAFSDASVPA